MSWRALTLVFVAVLGLAAPVAGARAQATDPKAALRLVSEHATVAPGGTVTLMLHQDIQPGWHISWRNPGDAGATTEIKWNLPEGWTVGDVQWPYPHAIRFGPFVSYGHTDEAALLIDVTAPADARIGDAVTLAADATTYVCADVCIPEGPTALQVNLNVAAGPSPPQEEQLFAAARAALPRTAPWPAKYQAEQTRFGLAIDAPELAEARPREVTFFPYDNALIQAAVDQRVRTTPDGLALESAPDKALDTPEERAAAGVVNGVLVLTGADGRTDAFELAAEKGVVPAPESGGLIEAILFAFVGGLILNLMPCVLPVLSMKALALARSAHAPAHARTESLAYGGGVLVTFLALAGVLIAVRATGEAAGWGFQLQQPIFVAALALLMFAVGLNLSGLFEFGAGRLAGVGQDLAGRGGASGSFFTGMLAVVVATPCTAPYMAAALGFAATQPAVIALAVFLALAIGFAAPFVLVGFSPKLLARLPKPGTWMNVFKQALAFPMYGAAIWLVWVLSIQTGSDGVVAVLGAGLALAFALWAYGTSRQSERGGRIGLIAAVLALIAVVGLAWQVGRAGQSAPAQAAALGESGPFAYEAYSSARYADLRRANTPIFINATAAWCITCLVNDRVALSGKAVGDAFTNKGVVALKADWTNRNAEITSLLTQYGRQGVPLYLYVPAGGEPKVLPQILTQATVLAAIE